MCLQFEEMLHSVPLYNFRFDPFFQSRTPCPVMCVSVHKVQRRSHNHQNSPRSVSQYRHSGGRYKLFYKPGITATCGLMQEPLMVLLAMRSNKRSQREDTEFDRLVYCSLLFPLSTLFHRLASQIPTYHSRVIELVQYPRRPNTMSCVPYTCNYNAQHSL